MSDQPPRTQSVRRPWWVDDPAWLRFLREDVRALEGSVERPSAPRALRGTDAVRKCAA
jgi:hypothetical protein